MKRVEFENQNLFGLPIYKLVKNANLSINYDTKNHFNFIVVKIAIYIENYEDNISELTQGIGI